MNNVGFQDKYDDGNSDNQRRDFDEKNSSERDITF
jgi:hypothetical protein